MNVETEKQLHSLLEQPVELHPDLVPYLEESKTLGQMLRHPLVFSVPYTPVFNSWVNKTYLYKKDRLEEAQTHQDWHTYIFLHERPYRIEAFYDIRDFLDGKAYWELLGSIWADSENLWQYGSLLGDLLDHCQENHSSMMNEYEQNLLQKLPAEFVIWRGHQGHNRLGHSWTLAFHTARWFAQRFWRKRQAVVQARVSKHDVLALLTGRREMEIVVDPRCLRDVRVVRPVRRAAALGAIRDAAWEQAPLRVKSGGRSAHGIDHWEKVERNGLVLARRTPGCDEIVVQLFAYLHDARREDEHHDRDHGKRAAKLVRTWYRAGKLEITEAQAKQLVYACWYHNNGKTSADPTIGVCWDADRLDLIRVGCVPDPAFLSTQAGKESILQV